MKIACITDDDREISQHFGRARHYAVFTIEEDQVVGRELRNKLGHQQFAEAETHAATGPHGTDPASQRKHSQMIDAILDCQVLLCGGMGWGARQSLQEAGITPVATDEMLIEDAVRAYLAGTMQDRVERVH